VAVPQVFPIPFRALAGCCQFLLVFYEGDFRRGTFLLSETIAHTRGTSWEKFWLDKEPSRIGKKKSTLYFPATFLDLAPRQAAIGGRA